MLASGRGEARLTGKQFFEELDWGELRLDWLQL